MEDKKGIKREVIQSFLITTARYKFSIYEKRILSKIITELQPLIEGEHLHGKVQRTLFDDLRVEMSLQYLTDGDTNRIMYQQALKTLAQKGFEFENENIWQFCNIITSPKIHKNKGIVEFTIPNEMVDLFLNFTKGYSKYILSISLSLKSSASARMYELISNQKRPLLYDIQKLKTILGCENLYPKTSNFIQKIIEPAKKELDEKANWSFDFKLVRYGRTITQIMFTPINYKNREPEEVVKAEAMRRNNLSWYIEKDIRYFLQKTCDFTPREIKNNLATIQKFILIFADTSLDKIMEIWSRCQDKNNPKGYLIGVMKLEVE